MYQPSKPGFRVEDLVLEESLNEPILQLLLGEFIPSTEILGVAVLHPKRLAVYEVIPQGSLLSYLCLYVCKYVCMCIISPPFISNCFYVAAH